MATVASQGEDSCGCHSALTSMEGPFPTAWDLHLRRMLSSCLPGCLFPERAVNVPGMSNSSTVQDLFQALIVLWGWASDRQLVALEVTCHIWLSRSDPPSDPAMTRLTLAARKFAVCISLSFGAPPVPKIGMSVLLQGKDRSPLRPA